MEKQIEMAMVPLQVKGTQMDALEKRKFKDTDEAQFNFRFFADRLLDVNNWGKYAGMSAFQLIDSSGVRAERAAAETDFIRIDIPGPGTQNGMGYDWVRIEEISEVNSETENIVAIRVRPSAHPLSKTGEIAHFLKDDATSTFIIRQSGEYIIAEEHGRNELANTEQGSFYDKGRNFMVGMAAKIGLSYPQWKSLVKGLLED